MTDINERKNKIVLGVQDATAARTVRHLVRRFIPSDAFEITIDRGGTMAITLSDSIHPIIGGKHPKKRRGFMHDGFLVADHR